MEQRHYLQDVTDQTEGSGNDMMEWSDDEDLADEGSGGQNEGSGDMEHDGDDAVDDEHAIAPVITIEDIRHTQMTERIFTTTTRRGSTLNFENLCL